MCPFLPVLLCNPSSLISHCLHFPLLSTSSVLFRFDRKVLKKWHHRARRELRKAVKTQAFYWIVIVVVFLNSLTLALEHYDQPDFLTQFLGKLFYLCLFVFYIWVICVFRFFMKRLLLISLDMKKESLEGSRTDLASYLAVLCGSKQCSLSPTNPSPEVTYRQCADSFHLMLLPRERGRDNAWGEIKNWLPSVFLSFRYSK